MNRVGPSVRDVVYPWITTSTAQRSRKSLGSFPLYPAVTSNVYTLTIYTLFLYCNLFPRSVSLFESPPLCLCSVSLLYFLACPRSIADPLKVQQLLRSVDSFSTSSQSRLQPAHTQTKVFVSLLIHFFRKIHLITVELSTCSRPRPVGLLVEHTTNRDQVSLSNSIIRDGPEGHQPRIDYQSPDGGHPMTAGRA